MKDNKFKQNSLKEEPGQKSMVEILLRTSRLKNLDLLNQRMLKDLGIRREKE
jgi:hypothetical protein